MVVVVVVVVGRVGDEGDGGGGGHGSGGGGGGRYMGWHDLVRERDHRFSHAIHTHQHVVDSGTTRLLTHHTLHIQHNIITTCRAMESGVVVSAWRMAHGAWRMVHGPFSYQSP